MLPGITLTWIPLTGIMLNRTSPLDMCSALNLCISNGVCNGDLKGCLTYINEFGNSVNDYFIMSFDLFDALYSNCSLFVAERIDSKHMPLEFRFSNFTNVKQNKETNQCVFETIHKFSWNPDCEQQFKDFIWSDSFKSKLNDAVLKINTNINESIQIFNNALKSCVECMKKKIKISSDSRNDDWFDFECVMFRRTVRRNLRIFRKTLDPNDREQYCKSRREYKNLILRKKKEYKNSLFEKIITAVGNQNTFWKQIKSVFRKKAQQKHNISVDDWYEHFKFVLEKNDNDDFANDDVNEVQNMYIDDLDKPISKDEVLNAINKLKNQKAAGPDGMIGEFLKFSVNEISDYLVLLFNSLFDNGYYPVDWSESIILPLYKKGDVNNPNNYRGISLCNITSKVYSSIVNNRLKQWIDSNNITGEFQAGFKSNYSTIDHIFTLFAAVQKQFSKNRKLYVAFIDFQKAFDSISRKLLWPVLVKNRIHGKLLNCIKSMYSDVKAKVRSGSKFTDLIRCTEGVKQGDVCSPLLFSLFINELALEIMQKGRHGLTLTPDVLEIFILLFADDIVLMSETVVGLQVQLNNLHNAATKLELKVNLDKSNIIVFRKGGIWQRRKDGILGVREWKL